ncbi:GNAT family N-acetyltransferase [Ponticoccus sp. SC2-23]|nr:GNAT family N-acetyltransferase [Alexandriicola marinus]MBM1220152.1 GNAT family N-acetyltransferase [Ponticoccus sp. SC6-9]MBM1224838.1 GNAT family N-acetyltransferase [Ponticoccus sp. SC6-15]MBM1228352.1 GNAT family N-acetyltransferase [Ponticoccus sp. SC6-38]MBM1234011.1 GNAT family N-acetyltransferase [Ponticoccus sp. SC6-45]MBM1238853.1 GNAT family N-acetyltransferase [Ponticoccus sp. SC6-49]MBM1242635.1 GNAT family N-acetyltransferase [Ponticoccus sp. SC2-64]MBM1247535.1 GNAT family
MTPEAMSELHGRAFASERGWSPDEFAALLSGRGVHLVTRDGAFLLGRAIAGEAEILTLATDPRSRRKGLARAMLRDFMDIARDAGCDRLFLEVARDNGPALALYAGEGFARIGTRRGYFSRDGRAPVDAIMMERVIGAESECE